MIINYSGKQFFKIQQGDMVFAFNPISKDSKFSKDASRFGADLAFISTNHKDFNGVDTVSHGNTTPFVFNGPGDYEVKGYFVKGLVSQSLVDGKPYVNTVYSFSIDGMNVCFLGALSDEKLSTEARESIDTVDILFVPIGGDGVLDPHQAYKIALSLEPKIIIPMDFGADKQKDALKLFLKEGGQEKATTVDKLTLKRKDLEGKDGEIIVLE